jgi:small subunit ribosomal protein S1
LKTGEEVTVKILKFNREENKIFLGIKQINPDPWISVQEKYPVGSKAAGKVVNLTDYGAFVEIESGLEGLIHISEMSWTKLRHPSQKLKVGDEVEVMVLDINTEARRMSLGLKQIEANPWEDLDSKYPKGTLIKGVVKNLTDFGVFVGVEEGIDGLVHISDLSWKKVKHPSEIFTKGDEVEAVVLSVDKQAQRFSLSTKLVEKNPWEGVEARYKPGMILEGRVTSIADFGAFVEIENGLEGLVHISELNRDKKKGAEISQGARVEVEVLNVDPEEKKIGLSIRSVLEPGNQPEADVDSAAPSSPSSPSSDEEPVAKEAAEDAAQSTDDEPVAKESVAEDDEPVAKEAVEDDAGAKTSEARGAGDAKKDGPASPPASSPDCE